MRVLVAGSSLIKEGGGIAAYNHQLCLSLLQAGHDLLFVTTEDVMERKLKLDNGKVFPIFTTPIPPQVSDEIEIAKKMFDRIVTFDPDVMISSNHIYLTSLFPCFADRRIRIAISHFYDGILAKTAACRHADTDWIISLSEVGKRYLIEAVGCYDEQVIVMYNSVPDVDMNLSEVISKKSQDKVIRIVFPGGSSRHKSPEAVVRLANELARRNINWELTWLGPAEKFERRISEGAREKVYFTGWVRRKQAEKIILDSHCIVLPSRGEGCPMTLVEAMRGGVIPLVSDCPSAMREIVANGISGFVIKASDCSKIANHLSEIATREELRTSLMIGSRQAYEKYLRFSKWSDKISELVASCRVERGRSNKNDEFDPKMLLRWHLRSGRWWRPTSSYVRIKIGKPNLTSIVK